MFWLFHKLFVRQFYAANAGFFLFFFFLFFGAVQGGSLVSYHLSLMKSILGSLTTLSIVLLCWLLYYFKCLSFILRTIKDDRGSFLHVAQAATASKQKMYYFIICLEMYAPVFMYGVLLSTIGFKWGLWKISATVLAYQITIIVFGRYIIYRRMNDWITLTHLPSLSIELPKRFLLIVTNYFAVERKVLLLVLKSFSMAVLYLVLVGNKDRYSHDSFLLFYLLILLAHAVLPFLAVAFVEKKFSTHRNLPIPLWKTATLFLLAYVLTLLPELLYIIYRAENFALEQRCLYYLNFVCSLFLLTAIQYANASSKNEYVKAVFGIVFFSIFALHAQVFWLWIGLQFTIAAILFFTGYYRYEINKNET